ncbi:MAG: rod shape-determining protein MreC [Oscillospiraceae bacterium]|nr:rod shape-determining protein MreC [Oscillospiraceae bacterium]
MKHFFSKYGVLLLVVTVLLAVLLSALSYFSATSSILRNAMGVVSTPFRAAASGVTGWFEDKRRYYADYSALVEENQALREELAALRSDEQQAQHDREENKLLRELLDLREQRRDFVFESAKVLEHSASNWTRTLTLNRGTSHGVAVNNVVVSSEGYMIGIVTEVGLNWCAVQELVDTDTEIGALVFRTGDVVIAEGDFALMQKNRLKVTYLPPETALLVGDYILTSGLGGYYPSNITLGTVERVETDDNGLAQYAVLAPLVDFDALTEVFIIKDYEIVE